MEPTKGRPIKCVRHRQRTEIRVRLENGDVASVELSPLELVGVAEEINSAVAGLVWWHLHPPAATEE